MDIKKDYYKVANMFSDLSGPHESLHNLGGTRITSPRASTTNNSYVQPLGLTSQKTAVNRDD